jgi:hypothetical protein
MLVGIQARAILRNGYCFLEQHESLMGSESKTNPDWQRLSRQAAGMGGNRKATTFSGLLSNAGGELIAAENTSAVLLQWITGRLASGVMHFLLGGCSSERRFRADFGPDELGSQALVGTPTILGN